MKSIFMAAIVLFATSPLFAGGNTAARKASYEQRKKQENAKCAAKYAKQSKQFLNAKLNECNAKASPEVRAEAEKEVALKRKMGNLLQQLSTAYKSSDMEAVKKLREEKSGLDRSMELARRKAKMARYLSDINDKLAKLPNSSALKDLKAEIAGLSEKYIAVSEEINAKVRERAELESKMKELRNEAQKTYYSEKKKKRGGAPCKSKKSKSLKL